MITKQELEDMSQRKEIEEDEFVLEDLPEMNFPVINEVEVAE